jgi:hypothetical protein
MNSSTFSLSRRAGLAVATVQLGGLALLAGALGGCARRPIIVQAPPATVIQNPAPVVNNTPAPAPAPTGRDVIVIKEAPPPPREEAPPPPPSERYTWIPGYWTSRDGRQEWVAGRWEMPPRTGATWVSPRWERRGEGYVFIEGYWR